MVWGTAVLMLAGGVSACAPRGNEAAAAPVTTSAAPAPVSTLVVTTGSPTPSPTRVPARTPEVVRAEPVVRIMPLGDSITYGLNHPDHGSYRAALGARLTAAGVSYDFVGSMSSGPAGTDRDNEGHIGWRIDQIAAHAGAWMAAYRPRLVLLHIGTNDMRDADVAAGAGDRLAALLDRLLAADPDVHVVVAQIAGAKDDDRDRVFQRRIDAYNALIPGIVAARGPRAHLADMRRVDGADLADTFHPADAGYRRMAKIWFRELMR